MEAEPVLEPRKPVKPIVGPEPIKLDEYIEKQTEAPYSEDIAKRIKMFFKKRKNNTKQFTYSDTGDLEVRSKSGAVEDTIRLRTFVLHEEKTREAIFDERKDALGEAEAQYEKALEELRRAQVEYRATGSMQPVLAAQQAAKEADQRLTRIRYGTRDILSLPNPETREILFENYYGDRVEKSKEVRRLFKNKDPYGKELYRLAVLELPYTQFYGKYIDTPVRQPQTGGKRRNSMDTSVPSDGTLRQKLRDGRWVRFFFETEGPTGFLSPFWPVEFTMDSVRYVSAYQAFEYQRATEAEMDGLKKNILQTRSVRTIRFLTKDLHTQPKNVPALWLRIFTAVYQQHPELARKLLETETDTLVFADPRDGPSGIGLAEGTREALDSSKWKGTNAVGMALETLRYSLREGSAAESAVDDAPTASVISLEDQQKAKVGAIIGAKKRFFNKG